MSWLCRSQASYWAVHCGFIYLFFFFNEMMETFLRKERQVLSHILFTVIGFQKQDIHMKLCLSWVTCELLNRATLTNLLVPSAWDTGNEHFHGLILLDNYLNVHFSFPLKTIWRAGNVAQWYNVCLTCISPQVQSQYCKKQNRTEEIKKQKNLENLAISLNKKECRYYFAWVALIFV